MVASNDWIGRLQVRLEQVDYLDGPVDVGLQHHEVGVGIPFLLAGDLRVGRLVDQVGGPAGHGHRAVGCRRHERLKLPLVGDQPRAVPGRAA